MSGHAGNNRLSGDVKFFLHSGCCDRQSSPSSRKKREWMKWQAKNIIITKAENRRRTFVWQISKKLDGHETDGWRGGGGEMGMKWDFGDLFYDWTDTIRKNDDHEDDDQNMMSETSDVCWLVSHFLLPSGRSNNSVDGPKWQTRPAWTTKNFNLTQGEDKENGIMMRMLIVMSCHKSDVVISFINMRRRRRSKKMVQHPPLPPTEQKRW